MDSVEGKGGLILYRKHQEEMLSHILSCLPEEACGLIASSHQVSQAVYPIPNELHSPKRFRMDPVAQVQAFLDIEKRGWELAAIYHSHPKGPPEPSETDLAEFDYPGVVSLIWHPDDTLWACGCYVLSKTGYQPIQFQIVEGEV